MTIFYLIRHASCDHIGNFLAGRMSGVHLNQTGQAEVARLAERLASVPLTAIFSSPLERARETAAAFAYRLNLEVEISEHLHEIDYGEWTGLAFNKLDPIPYWQRYNINRSITRVPGGEMMLEVQARMVGEIERIRKVFPTDRVAIVSHGDPIKTALAYYTGIHLELFRKIEISPASVSIVEVNDNGSRILAINDTGELMKVS